MPHPAYHIRTATADDLTAVQGLLEVSYAVLWPSHYDAALLAEILPVSARANPALLASGHYFVACIEDGQIIGAGGWSQEPPGRRRKVVEGIGHIRQFCVHPDHARRGVGRRLFEHCAAQATAAGITRFEVYPLSMARVSTAPLASPPTPMPVPIPDRAASPSARAVALP